METADVVIVGGGLIGLSIAFRLADLFDKVMLVEKGEVGGQTSAACDKAVFLQSKKPGYPLQLAKVSKNLFVNLEDELGMPFEFKPSGGMIVIENKNHLPFMREFVRQQKKGGIDVQLLDRKETLEKQPCLNKNIVGSTFSKEDAEVNPLLLSYAFALAIKRKGVDIRLHTEVTNILVKNGKVTHVMVGQEKIATPLVINAAGPYATAIAKMVQVSLPIRPRRGVILITERREPIVNGSVLCSEYIATKHEAKESKGISPIGLSLGQMEAGNLLIGGSREFVGFNKKIAQDLFARIAKHALRIVPALRNVRIIRTMVGFRPYTGDGLPIIDFAKDIEGFLIAAGHEGDGIALTPITGKLVADLVSGKENKLLQPLTLDRFKTSSC